jgi:hypothetical protein
LRARAIALAQAQHRRMRTQSYPLHVALTELGFAIAAFGCGLYDAPMWVAGLASFGLVAYWSHTRRAILNRLRGATWARGAVGAVLVLIAIQAGAYWLGLGIGEQML